MTLDLEFDDTHRAIAEMATAFCVEHDSEALSRSGTFSHATWRALGELGVLGLATPEGDGGAVELAAAAEALGRACLPGPLAATCFATQLTSGSERVGLTNGSSIVALGTSPLLPWAPVADLFLAVVGDQVYRGRPVGAVEPVETLGAEPWGRIELERGEDLGACPRTRRQFGRAIGEFQAVAHPLADCSIRLDAAASLVRLAASQLDETDEDPVRSAAAARLSATGAGLETIHSVHQVFGAVGITTEGALFHASRRIRQLVSLPPGEARARDAVLATLSLEAS
jgi:alkylation response protein AidB-like acyl-CoA dehydrogenase